MHPKVAAGAIVGAITVILAWIAQTFAHVTIPAEISSAITTVLSGAAAWWIPANTASEGGTQ